MTHIPNTHGGGAKTNKNGLRFEQTTSLKDALQYHNFILNPISSNRKSIGSVKILSQIHFIRQ